MVSDGQRLLTIDDDPTICRTVDAIARTAGFETRSTTDGDEFFRLICDWNPTHVVLDLVMPEFDGMDVLHRLADMRSTAQVILTSGHGPRVVEAARKVATEIGLSAPGVLPKPFTPAGLRALLQTNGSAPPARKPKPKSKSTPVLINEDEIAAGIEAQQFTAHYQPKIDCVTGAIVGFEALARWEHPQVGLVMPDRFIAQAEYHGLIDGITRQISEEVVAWLGKVYRQRDFEISINLSAKSIDDQRVAEEISALCARHGIATTRVVLEVTETSAMGNPTAALELLTRFRIRGFQLSIDDFGIGYSSLAQLSRLPFSELKIDKSFVMTAHSSEESQKIVAALVGLARNLGLRTTAEGVEDAWTLDFLKELGCDHAQGYFIARPMPGPEVEAWVRQREETSDAQRLQ
ncbi:EAL domain-containing response regulator [Aquibaculum arenosum]|uniref:EAL domain-containing response regulator n=1 Tax=Aquibaculum arenosum TaxID=3032591 RepID=A0ABT5YHH1_9PROT|nr:EAL domain-containing response regulator [Fodinicurvata sp. CAU 1616]MDF2094357.1 EAL domain-containing response regulator [Fodinicurvata sp. CAU 1616]